MKRNTTFHVEHETEGPGDGERSDVIGICASYDEHVKKSLLIFNDFLM